MLKTFTFPDVQPPVGSLPYIAQFANLTGASYVDRLVRADTDGIRFNTPLDHNLSWYDRLSSRQAS